MTERVYMNQDDNKKSLTVKLKKGSGTDLLVFELGNKTHKLNLNSEDNQNDIKSMFCDLILLVETNLVEFVLDIDNSYDNNLMKDVAASYISDLNKEIKSLRDEILSENSNE